MEDVKVGAAMRAIRIRRGLRQADVAAMAGVSQAAVSYLERGAFGRMPLRTLRLIATTLGVTLALAPSWRGADLPKLLDERHAVLVGQIVARLWALGWEVRPEHTFAVYREQGSLDVFAWRADRRVGLVVEAKTAIVDLQDTLSTLDRKRRLAPQLARDLGWKPESIGTLLVLPEETRARNSVASHNQVFASAYPAGNREVLPWLREPFGDLRGVWFLRINAPGNAKWRSRGSERVRRAGRHHNGPQPRSAAVGELTAAGPQRGPEPSPRTLHHPG